MHYSAQPQQYGIRYRVELIRDIMETQHADKLSFVLQDLIPLLTMNLKCGIDAIIHFGTDKYKSIFGNYEAADIKSVMLNYGGSKEQQQAIERWLCDYADRRQTFDKTSTDL